MLVSELNFLNFMKFMVIIVIVPVLIILTFMLQNFGFVQKSMRFFSSLVSNGSMGVAGTLTGIRFTKIISLIVNWLLLTFLYSFIPHTKVKIGHAFLAGIFAGTIWYFIRLGLSLYFKILPQMNVLYGSLAFLPIFLFMKENLTE